MSETPTNRKPAKMGSREVGLPKSANEVHFLGRGEATDKGEGCANNWAKKWALTRSSEEEHMENALASGAEEGRDKLR